MAEYNQKLITFLKKNKGRTVSEREAVEASGIDPKRIGPALWAAEPMADPSLKMKATKSEIVKARKAGIRWERIACRTEESVATCKEIGGKEAEDVYVGRGTRGGDGNGASKSSSGRRQSAAKGTATSGRRAAANKGKAATTGRTRGARTRAERQAKSGSPK